MTSYEVINKLFYLGEVGSKTKAYLGPKENIYTILNHIRHEKPSLERKC